jgi:hypothetical protein
MAQNPLSQALLTLSRRILLRNLGCKKCEEKAEFTWSK